GYGLVDPGPERRVLLRGGDAGLPHVRAAGDGAGVVGALLRPVGGDHGGVSPRTRSVTALGPQVQGAAVEDPPLVDGVAQDQLRDRLPSRSELQGHRIGPVAEWHGLTGIQLDAVVTRL